MKRIMLCVVGAVAGALYVAAEQKTVPAGTTTTVAAADVASWASADIDIGAGATLCFSEPSDATFTGTITGSGNFVAKAASESVRPKMLTLGGDASGFTGAFFFSNVYFTVNNPQSVGSVAPITLYTAYTGDTGLKSLFLGGSSGNPYVYQNNLDIRVPVKTGGSSGLAVKANAVLAGSVLHRNGMLLGQGKISGPVTSSSVAFYVGDDLHIEGTVTFTASGAKFSNYALPYDSWGYAKSGSMYVKGRTENLAKFNPIDCYWPVYLEGDNLFGENVELVVGENSTSSGRKSFRLELNGHSQVFKSAAFTTNADPGDALKAVGGIGNTGAPATVTFANQDSAKWFWGRFDGHLSVRVAGSQMIGFVAPTNTMDGTITHAGGGGNIAVSGTWTNLKRIESVNGGLVDIRLAAILNPKLDIIDIDSTSKIKVATGLTITVRRLRINGVDVPPGSYNKSTPGLTYGRFENNGDGTVIVTGLPGSILMVF